MNKISDRDKTMTTVVEGLGRPSVKEGKNARLAEEMIAPMRAGHAVSDSEEQYRLVVENTNEGIIIIQDGQFRFVNYKFAQMVGCSREELVSAPFAAFIYPDDRDMVMRRYERRLNGENPPGIYTFRILDREGKVKWLEINAVLISWKEKPATLNFLTDISEKVKVEAEKKKVEIQLAQAQKIEALGRFAGGIAHDLNNILYPIIINIEMLLSDAEPGTELHETLQQTLTAAYRQRDLIKQILSFSRRTEHKLLPIRVGPLLDETLKLIRASLPSTIEIRRRIEVSSDMIMGDSTQIQQIVMNLFKNAADALESQKGVVEVSLTEAYLEPLRLQQQIPAGRYLKLTVRDTGIGIDPIFIDRLFEPFFTTKEAGSGIGMGLPVVHGIVKNHGGAISVDSKPGRGSTFIVYLPLIEEEAQAALKSPSPDAEPGPEE